MYQGDFYSRDYRYSNTLACPDNKICIPLDYCSDIVTLLNEATIPIHRFRQAVCGYVGKTAKVCCNSPRDIGNYNPDYSNKNPDHSSDPKPRDCGQSLIRSYTSTLGAYPFVARIGFINLCDGSIKYPCTGTILNERTVLTTATCALANSDDYKLHSVLIGDFDTSTNPDCNKLFCAYCSQSYDISYVVKHPNFKAETYERNIALVRLNKSIAFTLTAQPICYSDQQYITIGSTAILVGWGKLSDNIKSTEQQILPIKILQTQNCDEFMSQGFDVELCAVGYQDPCSGFSGSPLITRDGSGFTVIGMLSYGSSCDANKRLPSVFVNIQKYALWITENS
ncbi:phenoloxidase-activating factor 1-like [Microplitis demolitor]|uniref:phenoloxidase-activating factor 1-like n=1 Tax=Microplitis demolitor TaxID=69319 RepID=UPI0004CD5DD1|nr:phenoloxidase-activating factor 1-like [Microplitis demolitor]